MYSKIQNLENGAGILASLGKYVEVDEEVITDTQLGKDYKSIEDFLEDADKGKDVRDDQMTILVVVARDVWNQRTTAGDYTDAERAAYKANRSVLKVFTESGPADMTPKAIYAGFRQLFALTGKGIDGKDVWISKEDAHAAVKAAVEFLQNEKAAGFLDNISNGALRVATALLLLSLFVAGLAIGRYVWPVGPKVIETPVTAKACMDLASADLNVGAAIGRYCGLRLSEDSTFKGWVDEGIASADPAEQPMLLVPDGTASAELKGVGEQCGTEGATGVCESGLVCGLNSSNGDTPVCVVAEGHRCESHSDCEGLWGCYPRDGLTYKTCGSNPNKEEKVTRRRTPRRSRPEASGSRDSGYRSRVGSDALDDAEDNAGL